MEADQSQIAPELSGQPAESDASVPVRRDVVAEMLAASAADDGAAEPEADASADDGSPSESSAAEATPDEPVDADEADLQGYPESVREAFRALEPEQRKALYEHAEARVSDRIETERKRNDELAATQARAEAVRLETRSKVGRFIGTDAQTITLGDGTTRALPAYADLDRMLRSQSGRDQLYDKYALDQGTAEAIRAEWDERNQMLDAAADTLWHPRAMDFDQRFRAGIRSEGVDPGPHLDSADGPEMAGRNLVRYLKAEHAAEVAQIKRENEARAAAQNLNAEGLRGRVLAATSRRLPTGGRSGGGSSDLTLDAYNQMTFDERQKLTPAERDAMMAREMARNGNRRR